MANRLLTTLWANGWASRPCLDPVSLVRQATRHARCEPDTDESGWRARLDLLCGDLRDHARLTPLGRTIAYGQLVSALSARFRAHALWRRHPDIATCPLTAPVIVVGQMRSGTTRMQRLLACDPRLTYTRFFESWNPIPADDRRRALDGRKLKGWFGLACARLLNPGFDGIHPTDWHAPDEEIGLHNLSIFGSAFEAQWHVPNYTAAVEGDDGIAVYGEFRRLLQTLRWLRGDRGDRPWILKVPQFAQDLPALLRAFPDARIVRMHRDPDEVAASSAALVHNQMRLQAHGVDMQRIGREWSRKVALRERRMAAAKAVSSAPWVDVSFRDVDRDWAGEMERVYAMLGLPLDAATRATMRAYMSASHPERRRRHRYDGARYGLLPGGAVALGG